MVRILAFQASGPGSIPGRRIFWDLRLFTVCGATPLVGVIEKALLAQMVERKTLNLVVVGSIPTGGAFLELAIAVSFYSLYVAVWAIPSVSRFSSVGRASD